MTTINFRSRFVGRGERGRLQSGLMAPLKRPLKVIVVVALRPSQPFVAQPRVDP